MKKITMNNATVHTFKECVEEFLCKCKIKNLTDNSIKSYRNKLNVISEFIKPETPINNIDQYTINDLIFYIQNNHTDNPITINTYLRAIRALLNYCNECGWCDKIKIHLLKQHEPIKDIYNEDELSKLLKKPDKRKCSFTEYRTWVLENYLLGTGNRISTALDIQIKDIDFYNETVILRKTKNRKQQIIPLPSTLISILKEYLDIRGGEPDDYLFCNSYGEKSSLTAMQQMVSRYNRSRGVEKTSCHAFRHSFATMYLRNGGDIYRLQKLLGHSSVKVTEVYLHMMPEDLRMDYNKINPLESFAGNKKKIKMK